MAKVTSKGQITIPISIRKSLGIKEGDKILFIEGQDGVFMVNPDMLETVQANLKKPAQMYDEEPLFTPQRAVLKQSSEIVEEEPVFDLPQVSEKVTGEQYSQAVEQDPPDFQQNEELGAAKTQTAGFNVAALLDEIRSISTKNI